MSLFGSLMADVEDDPFFGSHMRHMRQMNNMMNSMFADPFGMLGGAGPLAIAGPRHGNAMMPFMPQMPSLNRLFTNLDGGHMNPAGGHMNPAGGHMNTGSSFSSSTVVMSSGPGGKPQVFSSTSSTKIGPNGIKETRKTLQDTRTGTKKMSIGHHIGERAHLIEREHNLYSGDAEERQEFINLEEEEAEDFDREFHHAAGQPPRPLRALPPAPPAPRAAPRAIMPALPPPPPAHNPSPSVDIERLSGRHAHYAKPAPRRPLRASASPLTTHSSAVRETYSGTTPHRQRHRHNNKQHRTDNN